MTRRRPDGARGAAQVEALLAESPPRFFAALGALDWYARSHRDWLDAMDLPVGGLVLEIGCATGSLTAYLADRGHRVVGLDRSDEMIRHARDDHPHLEFQVADATSLPYDDATFDAVVAASVVNVVEDPAAVIDEMRRVTVPGGTVGILVPEAGFTDGDLDALVEELGLTGFSRAALTKWHRSARKVERSRVEELLRAAGLDRVLTRSHLAGMLVGGAGTAP